MSKVGDHDHLTGNFKGAAHSYCKLSIQNPRFILIFVHNLSGYETHLFIKEFRNDNRSIN